VIAEPMQGPPAKAGIVLRMASPLPRARSSGRSGKPRPRRSSTASPTSRRKDPMPSIYASTIAVIVAQDELLHRMLATTPSPRKAR